VIVRKNASLYEEKNPNLGVKIFRKPWFQKYDFAKKDSKI